MIEYGGVQLKGCICELKFGYTEVIRNRLRDADNL